MITMIDDEKLRVDQFSDFSLLEIFEISVSLTTRFLVRFDLEVRHEADHPQGVRRTDVRLRNTFRSAFLVSDDPRIRRLDTNIRIFEHATLERSDLCLVQ